MIHILFQKGHNINVPVSLYIPPFKMGMYYKSELHTKESWEVYPDMPRGENEAKLRMIYLRLLDKKVDGFRYGPVGIELS